MKLRFTEAKCRSLQWGLRSEAFAGARGGGGGVGGSSQGATAPNG